MPTPVIPGKYTMELVIPGRGPTGLFATYDGPNNPIKLYPQQSERQTWAMSLHLHRGTDTNNPEWECEIRTTEVGQPPYNDVPGWFYAKPEGGVVLTIDDNVSRFFVERIWHNGQEYTVTTTGSSAGWTIATSIATAPGDLAVLEDFPLETHDDKKPRWSLTYIGKAE